VKNNRTTTFSFLLVIGLVFSSFSSAYASRISSETNLTLEEKVVLYKLDMIDDTLKSGINEIKYFWNDLKGIEQSIDLDVTVNSNGKIILVEEKKGLSNKELNEVKKSIELRDSVKKLKEVPEVPSIQDKDQITIQDTSLITNLATSYPDVPYKLNGGMTLSQFVNHHAFDRHKFEQNATSSCSRTRYARDIGVSSLRSSTVASPDEKYSLAYPAQTIYIKRFGGRFMSMQMSDGRFTNYHRVINNLSDPSSSTHHPYCI
jgi:hypothetical protein